MKIFGELFLMYCDDLQDMDLTTALQSLIGLFVFKDLLVGKLSI